MAVESLSSSGVESIWMCEKMAEPLTPEKKEIVLGGDCPECGGSLDLDTDTCDWCGTIYIIRFYLLMPN